MSRSPLRFARPINAPRSTEARRRKPRLTLQSLEDRAVPAQFTVTSNLGDNSPGTLGDMIGQANATLGPDEIVFDPSVNSITLSAALPPIFEALTITGPGAANLTVDGASSFNIFTVAGASDVTFHGMTITNGSGGSGSAIDTGGENVTIEDSVVKNNNNGTGAIYVPSGATGVLIVANTTISGNTNASGGIYFFTDGALLVRDSTISGNTGTSTAFFTGGGILFFGTVTAGGFSIVNSTICDNTTPSNAGGAGVNFVSSSGVATIQNSTITGNTATGSSTYITGGGVGVLGGYLALTVTSSVIAQNTSPAGPDLFTFQATAASGDNNLIGVDPGNFTGNNNLMGTSGSPLDPKLALLQNNGGSTSTREPLPGSPLLDKGSNPGGLIYDQRGLGYTRKFGSAPDIGAEEQQPIGIPFGFGTGPSVSVGGGTSYTFTVTFQDLTGTNQGVDVSSIVGNDLAVSVALGANLIPATYQSIDFNTNGLTRTVTYSFTPPGGTWDSTDDGIYSILVNDSMVADIDGNFVPAGSVGSFNVAIPPLTVFNANDAGPGSLREAILLANSTATDDVILFDPTFFNTPQTIALASMLPVFSAAAGALEIDGPGAAFLTLDAGGGFRVLDSLAPTTTLKDFTITGGLADNTAGQPNGNFGGGIRSSGTLTLDGMVVTANHATGTALYFDVGAGGGIGMTVGATLIVRNSTISDNTADQKAGGIFMRQGGTLLVENSTISGNTASPAGTLYGLYGGAGIGVINFPGGFPPNGSITIANSTINNNNTTGSGGGIAVFGLAGTLTIQNSTITGNSAAAVGVQTYYTSPYIYGYVYGGGGIGILGNLTTVVIQNSVVSGNTNGTGPDISNQSNVNVYYSLIGDAAGNPSITLDAPSNLLTGLDPKLGPLQDNGGPTFTMTPQVGSPLLDAGDNASIPGGVTTDQRGFGRVFPGAGKVDIGAVEATPATPTVTLDPTETALSTDNTSVVFDVNFDQPVTGFVAAQVDFTGSTNPAGLVAAIAGSGSSYTVTVTKLGGGNLPDGVVKIQILAGTGTQGLNSSAQNNLASAGSASQTIDTIAPTVTIKQGSTQADPTTVGPIYFDVVFSEPVNGFGLGTVQITGTVGGSPTVTFVSQTGPKSYTVTVTGMTGQGTVIASIPAGAVTDLAGNLNDASTTTDDTVIFDEVPPTVTVNQALTQPDPTQVGTIVFDVVFSEAVTGFSTASIDLSTSTAVAGTGGFGVSISGTGPAYQVTVSNVVGRGDVILIIPAGAAVDQAFQPNSVSTGDNKVTFVHAGVVQFLQPIYAFNEDTGGASVTVTAHRSGGFEGVVTADYTVLADTAHTPSDYGTPSGTGTFTWGDGVTADQTFTIPIVNDSNNEGLEFINLLMINPTGGVFLGPLVAAKVAIAPSDGTIVNGAAVKPAKPSATFIDADGDIATVALAGKAGTATVYITDPDGDGHGPLELIVLAGTDATKSKLTVTDKKAKGGIGNGRVTIGDIVGTGAKSITAKGSDLIGTVGVNLTSFLGSLTVANITSGGDIITVGAPPAKPANLATNITAGVISDGTNITIAGAPLGNLTAVSIGVGNISAPSAGKIKVTGKAATKAAVAIPGDFKSNVTIAGTGLAAVKKPVALKGINVKGAATGVTITVGGVAGTIGNVGNVSFGSFVNSRLFAGYSGPDNGSGAFVTGGTIAGFNTTKVGPFAHSFVIADNIKNVSIATVDPTNATTFGFVFKTSFGGLTAKTTPVGKKVHYDKKLGGTQVLDGNFAVVKIP